MKIAYIVGYWIDGNFKSLYFYKNTTGDWFAKFDGAFNLSLHDPAVINAPTIFITQQSAADMITFARASHEELKHPSVDVFKIHGPNPDIVEIDINPLNVANMSTEYYNDYILHKLKK